MDDGIPQRFTLEERLERKRQACLNELAALDQALEIIRARPEFTAVVDSLTED